MDHPHYVQVSEVVQLQKSQFVFDHKILQFLVFVSQNMVIITVCLCLFSGKIFQLPRSLPLYHLFSIMFGNKSVWKFTAFSIGNFLTVVYIPIIIYSIIKFFRCKIINDLSIFNPDSIILLFLKGYECFYQPNF